MNVKGTLKSFAYFTLVYHKEYKKKLSLNNYFLSGNYTQFVFDLCHFIKYY